VVPLRRRHPGLEELYRNGHYGVYGVPPMNAGAPAPAASRRADAR
jgi:hypothetical protein